MDLEKEEVISHWEYDNGLEEEKLTKRIGLKTIIHS